MPQHKSAIKRVRQNEKRRRQNQPKRTKIKTLIKKALATTEKEEAREAVREATAYLDKMTTKGLIHKNSAARKKSKLARHLNNL